jgi:hypothetical protein
MSAWSGDSIRADSGHLIKTSTSKESALLVFMIAGSRRLSVNEGHFCLQSLSSASCALNPPPRIEKQLAVGGGSKTISQASFLILLIVVFEHETLIYPTAYFMPI